jgi:hypothetical protein
LHARVPAQGLDGAVLALQVPVVQHRVEVAVARGAQQRGVLEIFAIERFALPAFLLRPGARDEVVAGKL